MTKGSIFRSLLALSLLLLSGGVSQASEIHRIVIKASNLNVSMDQKTIQAITVGNKDILWVGTQRGLYRFDGAKLRRFSSDESETNWISISDIRGIAHDHDNKVFLTTYGGGLLEWSTKDNAFVLSSLSEIIATKYLNMLLATNPHLLWVGTTSGLEVIDTRFQRHHVFASGQSLLDGITQPTSIIENRRGLVFISTADGIYKYDNIVNELSKLSFQKSLLLNNEKITALCSIDDYLIAGGTNKGNILVIDISKGKIVSQHTVSIDHSNSITAIQRQGDFLWIGTDKGLVYSDMNLKSLFTLTSENSALSNNSIVSLYSTPELLFVGTYDGLNSLKLSQFETFNQRNSGVYNDVAAFTEDTIGRLWTGTFNGLYFFDPKTQENKRYPADTTLNPLRDERIVSLLVDEQYLWIGLYRDGIQVIDLSTGKDVTPDAFLEQPIYAIQMLSQNDGDIWIATYNHGLLRYSSGKIHQYFKIDNKPQPVITSLVELSSNRIILGTNSGIYHLDKNSLAGKRLNFNFESDRIPLITAMAKHPNGDIWVGTKENGFYKWSLNHQKNDTWILEPFYHPESLSSVTVNGILFDNADNAWVSTQRGIMQLDPTGNLLDTYTIANGLQGQDFNTGAAYKDSSGKLYFGGLNGYNRIDPSRPSIRQPVPPMRFTNVSLPGSKKNQDLRTHDSDEVVIQDGDYLVNFSYSVLDYLDPSQNQYRHMLENFDPDWIEDGNHNAATYTNLPAGNYILRVQGANSSGVWNRQGIALNVTVLPSVWLSWWARCLYAVASLFMFWVFKRTYNSYVIEKRAEALAEEMYEAMERADDDIQEQIESQEVLIKSVYRHNTSTLSLVREYLELENDMNSGRIDPDAPSTTEAISALSTLEKCLFYQENLLCADLGKYTDLVVSELLQDAPMDPETITTINDVSSDLIQVELASPLAILIFELVNNCVQHAFDPDSPANYIQIYLGSVASRDSSMLAYKLEISDSGKGLPQTLSEPPFETFGLRIVDLMREKLSAALSTSVGAGTAIAIEFDAIEPF